LACGKNLPGINNFLFDYLPIYNKFRTPEMALVIPQLLFPIVAVLTVNHLFDDTNDVLKTNFKKGAIAIAALFIMATTLYFTLDYTKENKDRTKAINVLFAAPADSSLGAKYQTINEKYQPERDNQFYEKIFQQSNGNTDIAKGLLTALKKDRQSFFASDIAKAFIFSLLTLALVGIVVYKKANTLFLLIGLPILVLADLLPIGLHYINDKNFDTKEKYQANQFSPSAADIEILKDKDPNYRVFDMSGGDPFQDSKPSYFHKSIGGYHPAKIGIFDDLATYQLSGNLNPSVLNMLNAKYIIQKTQDGKSTVAIPNNGALGNCWFVQGVKYVDGPVNEMKALDNFNAKDTAIIDNSFKPTIGNFSKPDSTATIKQTAFDNMAIKYESNSSTANVAVFSEIFYKDWVATIDGKEVPTAKANYVLRGLKIPAGKHSIEFKYVNKVYDISYTISLISMWLLMALLVWFGYYSVKTATKN
jgi:type III secretory pathway component EscR